MEIELLDRKLEDLKVGQETSMTSRITQQEFETFKELTGDKAPVHWKDSFAKEMGYASTISYGLLVLSKFSGLLGMQIPGPRSVIVQTQFKWKLPVFVGDELTYKVRISKIATAVRLVVLQCEVVRNSDLIGGGEFQCLMRI